MKEMAQAKPRDDRLLLATNSASYLQRDRKWVPGKVRWCSAAGE